MYKSKVNIHKPYIALFISIISMSFAAIFIVSCKSPPLSIAFYRMLFTTLLILPLVILKSNIKGEIKSLPRSNTLFMIIIGIILALHFAFWITSLTKTSVASSVILVTAHPILVAPLSYYLLKERMSIVNIIGIVLSMSGVSILVLGNYSLSPITLEGNILAILGGATAGIYILGGRISRKKVSISSYAFIVYSVATAVLLIICLSLNAPIYNLNPQDYWIILLMAIIAGIFGHTLYNWSLKYITASVASVALLGEPIGSSLFAFILPWIHQIPTIYTLIGGAITLSGIYLTARQKSET
jgi:drug/metabolite transporter (DMT)-like permease